jgi:flavin reductase (DIM6/NTAB) family NADH-FMN oxidoreductase RutF
VSVLAADQEQVARHFADRGRPRGLAQFAGLCWRPAPAGGAPLLAGAIAWLECELAEMHPGGDHSIVLGRVLSIGSEPARDALLFFGGRYEHTTRPAERPTTSDQGSLGEGR